MSGSVVRSDSGTSVAAHESERVCYLIVSYLTPYGMQRTCAAFRCWSWEIKDNHNTARRADLDA